MRLATMTEKGKETIMATDSASQSPSELFTSTTFRTLGGCVAVAGVVATVVSGIFRWDPKIVGLIVSFIVAYAALFMARKRKRADYFVSGFNGFLIYFTLVGATSFYPYLNNATAGSVANSTTNGPASPFRPWVPDRNLVSASRDLLEVSREQKKTLDEVHTRFDSLDRQVQSLNIPAATKTEITHSLAANKNMILMTHTNNAVRVTNLKRLGIHE